MSQEKTVDGFVRHSSCLISDMEFDRFSVALLILREDAPQLEEIDATDLQDAHMSHLADLHEAGYLLAAGPVMHEDVRGVCIFKSEPETAQQLMDEDPAVRNGRFEVQVMPWLVPEGAMSFAPSRFPRSLAESE